MIKVDIFELTQNYLKSKLVDLFTDTAAILN